MVNSGHRRMNRRDGRREEMWEKTKGEGEEVGDGEED